MSITKKSGRQEVLSAEVTVNYSDLTSGSGADAIELPAGAQVIGGAVVVDTAFNSATSDSLVVGDASVANRYLGSTSIAATGRTALVPTGYKTTAIGNVQVKWTGAGAAPSAGSFRLRLEYVVDGRVAFSQGLDARPALPTGGNAPGA